MYTAAMLPPIALAASAVAGVFHQLLLGTIWFYIATYDPTVAWMLEGLRSTSTPSAWYALLYGHDLLVNVLLALPLAVLITYASPSRRWLLTLTAVVAGFVFSYRGVLTDQSTLAFFLGSLPALLGMAMTLLSLPIAMLLVRSAGEGGWAPNKGDADGPPEP